jgi:gliding motility-associated-like protein
MIFTKNKILFFVLSLSFLIFSTPCFPQGIGNGQDGSPSISGIVNSYTYLINDLNPCDYELHVADASNFKADDLILIIQMQGALIDGTNTPNYGTVVDYENAGNYEYAKVQSVSGNIISLQYSLLRSYIASYNVQIVNVPQYENPTINGILTCPEWNGKTGGILIIDALETITMNSYISTSGKGFRGGAVHDAPHIFDIRYDYVAESPDPQFYALKGEGIAFYGNDPFTSGRGAPANGGGGGNIHTTGGGGGSNFGCGGDGGWGYPIDGSGDEKLIFGLGGHSITYTNTENKIFMGGGGGAGHEHFGNGTSGASGGGIVIITSKAIDGRGYSIFARGNNSASGGSMGDGVGGAGAGGSVLLAVEDILSKTNIDITGGSGGSTMGLGFGPGGGAGGGVCWFGSPAIPDSATVTFDGGTNGVAGGNYYGGSIGCNGGVLNNLIIPFDTIFLSLNANFSMTPANLTAENTYFSNSTTITFNNLSSGGTSSYWNFGDNNTSTERNPIHTFGSKGIFNILLIESNDMCSDSIIKEFSFLPNIFTPNGDNHNDIFPNIDYNDSLSLTIYNRWGMVIFNSNKLVFNWDGTNNGKEVPAGTYFYLFKSINQDTKEFVSKGSVTLLR